MTGYYELASKIVIQFRLVISTAFQMLVPFFASYASAAKSHDAMETDATSNELAAKAYLKSFRLVCLLAIPYFGYLACILPFFLTAWTGEYSRLFIAIGIMCLCGWFINTFALPAFMLYLATGRVHRVALTQLLIGCLNLVAGAIAGWLSGGMGVILVATVSYTHLTLPTKA